MKNVKSSTIYLLYNRVSYILLLVVFLSATLDTNWFVYPSLSRTLVSEIFILLLVMFSLACCISRKNGIMPTRFLSFIFVWIVYIVLHYFCSYPHEQYHTLYLVITLSLLPTVVFCLRQSLINRSQCENIILLIAVIHIFFIAAQWSGFIGSGNKYFMMTGSNENPTVTALYLVGCVPIIATRLKTKERRVCYILFLATFIMAIILLRCRTAYIGMAIEASVGTIYWFRKKGIHLQRSYKYIAVFLVSLILVCISVGLYNAKRESADGRWLIWKLSAKMIIDNPQGYGYGLFEKYYNLCQAQYFAQGDGTEVEKFCSDHVFMAYNDFLEQGVEGGVIGMLFFIAFYLVLIYKALRQCDIMSASVISSFAVMSLTNFVYTSIQPWYLLLIVGAFVVCDEKKFPVKIRSKAILMPLLIIVGGCLCKVCFMTKSQIKLADYKDKIVKGDCASNAELLSLQPYIGTSEAYYNLFAYNMLLCNNSHVAIEHIVKAFDYTSSPQTYRLAYLAYNQSGREDEGIRYINVQRNMMPMLLEPKLLLMEYYSKYGRQDEALFYAKEIEQTPHKINNEKSESIRCKAHIFIENTKTLKR